MSRLTVVAAAAAGLGLLAGTCLLAFAAREAWLIVRFERAARPVSVQVVDVVPVARGGNSITVSVLQSNGLARNVDLAGTWRGYDPAPGSTVAASCIADGPAPRCTPTDSAAWMKPGIIAFAALMNFVGGGAFLYLLRRFRPR